MASSPTHSSERDFDSQRWGVKEEAIRAYDETLERFGTSTDGETLISLSRAAYYYRAYALEDQSLARRPGRGADDKGYDETIARFGPVIHTIVRFEPS